MKIGERQIEAAEASVTLERDTAIARIRSRLAAEGSDHCRVCGDDIEEDRRRALPSAERCIVCQERHERAAKRRAA